LRLNRFLHSLTAPAQRQRFMADEAVCLREATLTDEERQLVRERDWRGLIHYGVIFFLLEKLGAVVGVSNLHIYAAMRGEPLDRFMQTRNAPGALYSVASGHQQPAWRTQAPSSAA
jgi:gallate dioxygenase